MRRDEVPAGATVLGCSVLRAEPDMLPAELLRGQLRRDKLPSSTMRLGCNKLRAKAATLPRAVELPTKLLVH